MNEQNNITPLMVQYQKIRSQHPNEVLFFRVGDFYEMFDEDALEISRLLNLTLTHKGTAHMCGIPFHAAKTYVARLLRLGKKIAICEQVTLPTGKGLADRKVVEVITPGTTVEEDYLDRSENSYVAALCPVKCGKSLFMAFAWLDVSTAVFSAMNWMCTDNADQLPKELGRIMPRELLLRQSLKDKPEAYHTEMLERLLDTMPEMVVNYYPDWHFDIEISYKKLLAQFKTVNLHAFALEENSPEVAPLGFLLEYASGNAGCDLSHISGITLYRENEYMDIDDASRKNLELTVNLRDGTFHYTLLEVINHTVTPMGNRLLRSRLLSPLASVEKIKERQAEVLLFASDRRCSDSVRHILSSISDIERLSSRIAMDRAHAKDLQTLKSSIRAYLEMKAQTAGFNLFAMDTENAVTISTLIENAIADDSSIVLTEGRLIKRGWSTELDHLHDIQDDFSSILNSYIEKEKEKTGISSLKIRYNRVNGYYIEVTKSNLALVPDYFIRRRSCVNGERFTTERLGELEQELLSASEKIIELERMLFLQIRNTLKTYVPYLFAIASEIASLDVTLSHAYCAQQFHWICPLIDDSTVFSVKKGRHPVVEMHMPSCEFVPNDIDLELQRFALITGPNMAGKSTYLRQNALIAVLAQIGAFVPAEDAHIGIVDRIFCRVGASDNLARGESTFLVEMTETANILRSATYRSLVIMDEVGRGTSTEDGLSIAWAVSEYLLNNIQAKTLFATHYHELTRIVHPSMQLLCLEVLENEGDIVFLKRIQKGAAKNSYGLHVASLAGIPLPVVNRAREILPLLQQKTPYTDTISLNDHIEDYIKTEVITNAKTELESADTAIKNVKPVLPGLFSDEELILDEILSLNTDNITPLEALQKLSMWKKQLYSQ